MNNQPWDIPIKEHNFAQAAHLYLRDCVVFTWDYAQSHAALVDMLVKVAAND